MKDLIEEYLNDQKSAWSPTTLASESSRLRSIAHLIELGPSKLHQRLLLDGWKPYTIRTAFIRLLALEHFAASTGRLDARLFKDYFKKHKNRFKHAYQKEEIEISQEEVIRRINMLPPESREQAMGMLTTGVRLHESYKIKNGKVIGKGEKPRRVYGTIKETVPRSTFSRHLKSVGLKSHMFRKLCATKLEAKGATAADLCKFFGWTSIATAYQYLQARDEKALETLAQKASQES